MTTSQSDARTSEPNTTQTLKRRGLLAAGAAFVAGLVAKLSERPVSAGVDGDVVLGQFNTTSTPTTIENTTANSTGMATFCTGGTVGWGLASEGSELGVYGHLTASGAAGGAGVFGDGFFRADSYGVWGFNGSGTGVRAESQSGLGIHGISISNSAVLGQIPSSSNANAIAIYAQNYSTYAGGSPGAGGFAIYGLCAKGHGLVGATATAGGAAVVGATNGVAGAYAGAFYGPLVVSGNFTVVGGAKSAAVPHPDGSHRRLYCMESPESWFEDFGTGRLECGRAEVTIESDFAAMVDLTDYHIFLTEFGNHQELAVTARTPTGFTVEADAAFARLTGKKDSDLSGTFSWRVVARRKDIAAERLAPVTIPPAPTLPPVPDVPTATPPSTRLRR
jgi:hypothetical protein